MKIYTKIDPKTTLPWTPTDWIPDFYIRTIDDIQSLVTTQDPQIISLLENHSLWDFIDWSGDLLQPNVIRALQMTIDEYLFYKDEYCRAYDPTYVWDEDNIEDSEISEISEYVGNTQRAIDPKPEHVEDIEVHVDDEDSDEDTSKVDSLLNKFRGGLPSIGISVDSVINLIIDKLKPIQKALQPYRDAIELASSEESREAYRRDLEKQIDAFKKQLKSKVQAAIDRMSVDLKEIQDASKDMANAVVVISQIGLPSFVGTGAPNPTKMLADVMAYKSIVTGTIGRMNNAIMDMLNVARENHIPIMPPVDTALEVAGTTMKTLNSILDPVGSIMTSVQGAINSAVDVTTEATNPITGTNDNTTTGTFVGDIENMI